MDGSTNKALIDELLLRYQAEQFYIHEAELLDSRQFEAWLDLLAEDIRYWMPLARNQEIGEWDGEYTREGEDLNWFDEGKFELEQRVKQIFTGLHWSEEPVSRTCHMVSNLRVEDRRDGTLDARCRFLVYRNRTETETDFFVGKRHDTLRQDEGGFKIAARQIFLDQSVLLAKNLTIFF
jgi:3-phenylpropionate/cinnamic acid dioxygenase small subunit